MTESVHLYLVKGTTSLLYSADESKLERISINNIILLGVYLNYDIYGFCLGKIQETEMKNMQIEKSEKIYFNTQMTTSHWQMSFFAPPLL